MKRALVVASVVMAISTVAPRGAAAGGYAGLALGAEPGGTLKNSDTDAAVASPDGRTVRVLGGYRFGNNLAIEAAIHGLGVVTGRGDKTLYEVMAGAKFSLPLGNGFEAFGRAGFERSWIDLNDERYNLAGNGFVVGAGFEYQVKLTAVSGSIFVDYNLHRTKLEDERNGKVDGTLRVWSLGFTVGF